MRTQLFGVVVLACVLVSCMKEKDPEKPADPPLRVAANGEVTLPAGSVKRKQLKVEPVVLDDGTSVLFPSGWTDEDADKWRKGMELQRPGNYSARTHLH